jgi:NADPH-dependent curcumin reductase CurA
MTKNRQVLLKSRPAGEPTVGNFEIVERDAAAPGDGEVLVRTLFLSLDPYMRGRMNEGRSYAASVDVGGVMVGGTVGEVVESRAEGFAKGDIVLGFGGWQEFAVLAAKTLRKLDPKAAPLSYALGVLGMPGMTAYVGLLDFGQPKAGETVVVSAASGAVGSVVGQIAKIKGCRAVGIAGGAAKCEYVVKELGFDACVDHRDPAMPKNLRAACPNGIDVNFENVGGAVLQAIWPLMNEFGRVPLCGLIAHYNDTSPAPGPSWIYLLARRLKVSGFIVSDHMARMGDFLREMPGWLREGKVKYREDIVEGLEKAPEAFLGLLHGKNFGKMIVRVRK